MGERYEHDQFYRKYLAYISEIADSIQNEIPYNEKIFAAQRLMKKIIVFYILIKIGILQLFRNRIQLRETDIHAVLVKKSSKFHKFIYRISEHLYDSRGNQADIFPDSKNQIA